MAPLQICRPLLSIDASDNDVLVMNTECQGITIPFRQRWRNGLYPNIPKSLSFSDSGCICVGSPERSAQKSKNTRDVVCILRASFTLSVHPSRFQRDQPSSLAQLQWDGLISESLALHLSLRLGQYDSHLVSCLTLHVAYVLSSNLHLTHLRHDHICLHI